jgi:hypothetical protein
VCFLLSPGAAYITGTCIRVDGGSSLRPCLWELSPPDPSKWPVYGGVNDPVHKGKSDQEKSKL